MTQNNNQSMKTVVETFLVEETIELIHDGEKLQSWNEKVSELQLEGQTTLVKEEKSPIPFLWMNNTLVATFETLCPRKMEIEKYDKQPIPLEILELVALAKKEKYFTHIKIWYNEEKDPVCVGYAYEGESESDWAVDYYSKKYLIGRWADVKASLDALIEKARKLFIHNETMNLKKSIRDAQRKLEDIEHDSFEKFVGLPSTDLPF